MRSIVIALIAIGGCGRVGFNSAGSGDDAPSRPIAVDPIPLGSEDLPGPMGIVADLAVDDDRVIVSGSGGTRIYERLDAGWTTIDFPEAGTTVDLDGDLASIGWNQGMRILDRRGGAWVVVEQRDSFGVRGLGTVYLEGRNYRLVPRFDNDPGTEVELHHYDWIDAQQTWSRDLDLDVLLVRDGPVSANASAATHRGYAVLTMGDDGESGVYNAPGVTATSASENSVAVWFEPGATRVAVAEAERVVVWEGSVSGFTLIATIDAPIAGTGFGAALAFVGPRVIAIGAPAEDAGAGAVYTFGERASEWQLGERIVAGPVGIGQALDGDSSSLFIGGGTLLRRVTFASE